MFLKKLFQHSSSPTHRLYAVGDIHGCLKTLENLLSDIAKDIERHKKSGGISTIVFMGNYVDCGPDSKGVIDYLINEKLKSDGVERVFLRGNHDIAFQLFMETYSHRMLPRHFINMVDNGGLKTFASYGAFIDPEKIIIKDEIDTLHAANIRWIPNMAGNIRRQMSGVVPKEHLNFLRELQTSYQSDNLFFCHAGVDPLKSLAGQDVRVLTGADDDLAQEIDGEWQSSPSRKFATYDGGPIEGKIIVHGHSVVSLNAIERSYNAQGRIPTNSGVFLGGSLSAVVFENSKKIDVFSITSIEPAFDRYHIPVGSLVEENDAALWQTMAEQDLIHDIRFISLKF